MNLVQKELTTRQKARRASILQAVRHLLTQCGYDGLSMRQVAVEAGVSPSTLYEIYESKDTLILHRITNYYWQSNLVRRTDKVHLQASCGFNQDTSGLVRSKFSRSLPSPFRAVFYREVISDWAHINVELRLAGINANINFFLSFMVHRISFSNLRYGLEAHMTIRVMPSEFCSVPTCHRSLKRTC